jgi:hypothetical protein
MRTDRLKEADHERQGTPCPLDMAFLECVGYIVHLKIHNYYFPLSLLRCGY